MKIQVGEIVMADASGKRTVYPVSNKTKKYLTPVLREYGDEFVSKYSGVFKVAIGIGDFVVENRGFKFEKHLFILADTVVSNTTPYFIDFLMWVRNRPDIYQDDYVFGNIQKSSCHMIIIKFPEKYYSAFETFKIGDYSKMFNKKDIDKFFTNHPKTQRVFIKDHEYKFYFVGKLNKMFSTLIDANTYTGELELPPTDQEEKFNHHLKK